MMKKFDETDPKSILEYADKLKGKTFLSILDNISDNIDVKNFVEDFETGNSKGDLGNFIEKYYFGYSPNSRSQADFHKAGVELKVTPFEDKKSGGIKAGERLVLGMIPNKEPLEERFEDSHIKSKIYKMLLIWYKRVKGERKLNYLIEHVNLFDLGNKILEKDYEIIKSDYEKIAKKVIEGKAHELSEGDTMYLGACTKGATASKSLQPQFYNESVPAKRRAFSLKQSYMTYVLNNYVNTGLMNYEAIFTNDDLKHASFEDLVTNKLNQFIGWTEEKLYERFEINPNAKNKNNLLVTRMLGIKTDHAEEFEKANIEIKTIRAKKDGMPKESMSFPYTKISDFISDNSIDEYFLETKFLFVVFKESQNNTFELNKAMFWNMPVQDYENFGLTELQSFRNKFVEGVNFNPKINKNGKLEMHNDLPKEKYTTVFHMRPHANKSAYVIGGIPYGNGSENDMDELPNGDKMTKQSIWINKRYLKKVIGEYDNEK